MRFTRTSCWLCALFLQSRALAPLRLVVRTCGSCATGKFDAQQALDGLAKSSENAEVTSGACDGECAGPSVSVEIDGEAAVSLRRPRSPPNLISPPPGVRDDRGDGVLVWSTLYLDEDAVSS